MGNISTVTVGKLIEAFHEEDEQKFFANANLIADNLEKDGDLRGARIIRSKINKDYLKDSVVSLDNF